MWQFSSLVNYLNVVMLFYSILWFKLLHKIQDSCFINWSYNPHFCNSMEKSWNFHLLNIFIIKYSTERFYLLIHILYVKIKIIYTKVHLVNGYKRKLFVSFFFSSFFNKTWNMARMSKRQQLISRCKAFSLLIHSFIQDLFQFKLYINETSDPSFLFQNSLKSNTFDDVSADIILISLSYYWLIDSWSLFASWIYSFIESTHFFIYLNIDLTQFHEEDLIRQPIQVEDVAFV